MVINKASKCRRKKHIFPRILIIILLVILAYLTLYYFFHIGIWIPKIQEKEDTRVEEKLRVGTVYELNEDNIKYDDGTGVNYINNIVVIFFSNNVTEKDIDDTVAELNGEIVGSIPVINQYQIKVPEKTYAELVEVCNKLEEKAYVDSATIDQAIKLQKTYVNRHE